MACTRRLKLWKRFWLALTAQKTKKARLDFADVARKRCEEVVSTTSTNATTTPTSPTQSFANLLEGLEQGKVTPTRIHAFGCVVSCPSLWQQVTTDQKYTTHEYGRAILSLKLSIVLAWGILMAREVKPTSSPPCGPRHLGWQPLTSFTTKGT